ncbi:MAG: 2-methylaconitate cis-trans isomerase PrpF family protein, partial [Nitrososphaeraceae archaeon]|nr:2-methylaconitate cis-trans isomerase PrpF family protein [Nitrososphaeraceae archaeon]
GSPDPNKCQIDGMGGATSVTSKVAIISSSEDPNYDVNYLFGQVSIDKPIIDYKANCGNILSAVGPFAIDEGIVPAKEPVTLVRIFQVNTKTKIIAEVPVKEGKHQIQGEYKIDGVPGTSSKISLRFINPGGAITGKLLPTGNVCDFIEIPHIGRFNVSIVDASILVVFVLAEELGLEGTEIEKIKDRKTLMKLELIRSYTAVYLGLAKTPEEASDNRPTTPKIAIVSPVKSYTTSDGRVIDKNSIDILARYISMGTLHSSYALTGAICTTGAAKIKGTIVNQSVNKKVLDKEEIILGHPGGIMPITPKISVEGNNIIYLEAKTGRTARKLMDGFVYVPKKLLEY